MKTPRLAGIVVAVLLTTAVAFYWWLKHHAAHPPSAARPVASNQARNVATPASSLAPQQDPNAPTTHEPDRKQQDAFLAVFLKPFSFIGRIVDDNGLPVSDATAEWRANNNPNPYGTGATGKATTDSKGMFSVNSHGMSLFVKVWKRGFYEVPTDSKGIRGSSGGFSNAEIRGNTDSPMGTESSPAVFVLRKKGESVALIHASERPVKVPKDGAPVEIALENGKPVPPGQGDLRIECWTEDQVRDAQGNYPWHCRVSVPGGGLAKREGEFLFEAPPEGYQRQDDMTPPDERWSAKAERSYFVKTAGGHFARVNLRMHTGGEHFVVIESYFNPQPGSRNLEYDPNNIITSQ
jgi:hypothetical protein